MHDHRTDDTDTHGPDPVDVDSPVLRRIRALLDKAASTEFGPEAEALIDKALELQQTYHVTEALLEAARDAADPDAIVKVSVTLGAGPYVQGRLSLLGAVGAAHDCRVLTAALPGCRVGYLIGHRSDVRRAEVLFTSLLTQATSAMTQVPVPRGHAAVTFRRSFLLAYAHRIGARLTDARARAVAARDADSATPGTALVLANRAERVDDWVNETHGRVRRYRTRPAGSTAGAQAGASAAERADLGTGTGVTAPTRALSA